MLKKKIAGAIYGQFIGDGLGTRYEFQKRNNVQSKMKNDSLEISSMLPILGGGPFKVLKGQVTDDTELAMGLLHSILENQTYSKEMTAQKYIKWYNSNPFDIGNTTRNAFRGASNYNDIINNSERLNKQSLSNGCLMRISPLAIYGIKLSDEQLIKFCNEDTIMTNPNEIALDAVVAYCIALKTTLLTQDKKIIYDKIYANIKTDVVKNILYNSLSKPEPVVDPSGESILTDSSKMGYFGIALQNAFYELFNGISFYSSLVNIISKGGDTDTNGCIGGALLGAYYGIDNIPPQWILDVQINNPRSYDYTEIDQMKINENIDKLINLIYL